MRPATRIPELLKGKLLRPGAPAWSSILLALGVVILVGLNAWKAEKSAFVPGTKGQNDHVAHFDYGYASYFPVRDFLAGNNPYEPQYSERNPDGEGYPAYSPIHLLLHAPFAVFEFETARWIYFGWNILLFLLVAWLVSRVVDPQLGWNAVLLVALVMLASRSGYKTLFYGQSTALVMLGSYLALWKASDRPWLAALGLALVSIKAQYLVPLGIFMLFRGNFRALFYGAFLTMLGSLIPIAIIAVNNGGLDPVISGLYRNYIAPDAHPAVHEVGVNWARMDFADQVAKWAGTTFPSGVNFAIAFGIWIAGGWILLRTRDREDLARADGAVTALILGLVLLSVYHVYYDFLFLTLPVCAILYRKAPFWVQIRNWQWCLMLFGFGLGMANHLIEKMAVGLPPGSLAWKIGVTANSTALLMALGLLGWLLVKAPRMET